ncbi:hypothetical protein NLG97_g2287 [Lecanicillium saksenae]|uniref:Uncharacterized protein n=1 Tax=Lecanicillium saksenae TaxID=468837 RepID=A0ACC1R373_9HYPO|nr:hypothetical protein NLG97_g2287 [Lecanicillium saksenae]
MRVLAKITLTSLAIRGVFSDIINFHHKVIENVVINVKNDIVALDSAVKSFSGDKAPVVAAAERLVATIKSGTTTVDGAPELSTSDMFSLQDPISSLIEAGFSLADYLKSRRADIESASLCEVVHQLVAEINTASQALINSVIQKFPRLDQSFATDLSAGLINELDQTQDDFTTTHCKNSSGGELRTTKASSPVDQIPSTSTTAVIHSTSDTGARTTVASSSTVHSTSDTGARTTVASSTTVHSTFASSSTSVTSPSVIHSPPTSRSTTGTANSTTTSTAGQPVTTTPTGPSTHVAVSRFGLAGATLVMMFALTAL